MLSEIEKEYLKSPERFDSNYQRVLRHRIKAKIASLESELPLLEAFGLSSSPHAAKIAGSNPARPTPIWVRMRTSHQHRFFPIYNFVTMELK
jgi:hypothetical protein